MEQRILLVDDDTGFRTELGEQLRKEGYLVETAADGDQGCQMAANGFFNLILLNSILGSRKGYDICRDLRQMGLDTPILMLAVRGETIDKVLGLKIGADDYLIKPFEIAELLARIEALLRRASRQLSIYSAGEQFGHVRIDFRKAEVIRNGEAIALSAKEYHLIRYLLEHKGMILSREELLRQVWGYKNTPSSRTVDVHIAWLRQKIEDDPKNPRWILTVRGLGYSFSDWMAQGR